MEFNGRLYELRKQKGMSQEELANRLNVTRHTVSKGEVGDSTPDMEKLVAISDLFGVSLDELVLGKEQAAQEATAQKIDTVAMLEEKVLTEESKKKAKKGLRIAAIVAGAVVAVDLISMIVYVLFNGFPE